MIFEKRKAQNIILLVAPMCQDTPCKMSDLSDHLCSCSTLIYAITSFRQMLFPERFFFGGWRLSTCDGPMYVITGNNSEKKVAKNILRGGPCSRPNTHHHTLKEEAASKLPI